MVDDGNTVVAVLGRLTTLVRITAPHFVAGVVVGCRAAPIIGYMKRWDRGRIVAYCSKRGWEVEEVTIEDPVSQGSLF